MPGWIAILGLLLCFPVGILLTLLTKWTVRTKGIAIGVVVGLAILGGVLSALGSSRQPTASLGESSPAANQTSQTQDQTPKPSNTATKSPTAPATQKPHFMTFGNGEWVVGKDIQPGTYRTRHDSAGCYFARLKGFSGTLDDIIANEDTNARAVVTIDPADKGFESRNCDQWSSDLSQITTSKTSFGDGDLIVGTDLESGTYRNTASAGCYYARLSGFGHTFGDIIANDTTDAQAIVTIAATDQGFESIRCGTWTKIG